VPPVGGQSRGVSAATSQHEPGLSGKGAAGNGVDLLGAKSVAQKGVLKKGIKTIKNKSYNQGNLEGERTSWV